MTAKLSKNAMVLVSALGGFTNAFCT